MMHEYNPSNSKKKAAENESPASLKRKQTSALERKQTSLFKKKNTFDRQLEINQKLMQSRIRGTLKMVAIREDPVVT